MGGAGDKKKSKKIVQHDTQDRKGNSAREQVFRVCAAALLAASAVAACVHVIPFLFHLSCASLIQNYLLAFDGREVAATHSSTLSPVPHPLSSSLSLSKRMLYVCCVYLLLTLPFLLAPSLGSRSPPGKRNGKKRQERKEGMW